MPKKRGRSEKPVDTRSELGRKAREKGLNFEERVAEIYRLLHYDVEVGRIFSGRQVDLFLTGRFGDLTVQRAIECKLGPVNVDDLDAFISKVRLVRRDYPAVQGTLISAVSFSDAVTAHAFQEGITLTLFRDLSAQLLDGHQYAVQLLKACEENEQYPIRFYIEHLIGWDATGDSLSWAKILREWLEDTSWNQLTLLGDVGTGKSFLCRMLAYELAKSFLSNPLQNPLPVLIDLRNADRQFSLEGLILTHLTNSGLSRVTFSAFDHALRHGNIVLILDGFDEMSARVTQSVAVRNFHELAKCVKSQAKVILTCRTHYFRSRTEEEEIILGGGQDLPSESARELYWDLISRKGFRIAYLRPFTLSQIESYLQLRRPADFKHALKKINDTYNLLELSQRPMLLEMIVKTLDKIEVSAISPAALYKVYTDAWIQRDHWRDVLTAEKKLAFLTGLARTLWSEETSRIHYSVLQEHLQTELAGELQDPQRLVEIDSEVRAASFLTRDSAGYYEFAHKSYSEFFLARALAERLAREEFDCLRLKRLSPEVVSFLFDLIDVATAESRLEGLLVEAYVPMLSENALIVLYGLRREKWRRQQQEDRGDTFRVDMPKGVRLEGANLQHLSLEGVVLREGQLQRANLQDTILAHADLSASTLDHALLNSAILAQASMVGASLKSCGLEAADLRNALLDACDLTESNLTNADLSGVSASGVEWKGARLVGAVFSDDLRAMVRDNVSIESMLGQAHQNRSQQVAEFWAMIETLLPAMRSLARTLSVRGSVEADDIVSEAVLSLVNAGNIGQIMSREKEELEVYLLGRIRTVGRRILDREVRDWLMVNYGVINDPRVSDDLPDHSGYNLALLDEDGNVRLATEGAGWLSYQGYQSDPLAMLLESERNQLLREMLGEIEDGLSPKFKTVFRRYYVEGLPISKIAELEGVSRVGVARILNQTRKIMLAKWSNLERRLGDKLH